MGRGRLAPAPQAQGLAPLSPSPRRTPSLGYLLVVRWRWQLEPRVLSGSSLARPSKPFPSIAQQELTGCHVATLTFLDQSQAWVMNLHPAGTLGWEGALPGGKLGYGAQETREWVLSSWNRYRLWSLAKGLRFTVAGGGSEAGTLGAPLCTPHHGFLASVGNCHPVVTSDGLPMPPGASPGW